MFTSLYENPTKERIVFLIKKNGPMTIDDMSKELKITAMGIRQHLLSLEKKELVTYITKRRGIGRPAFLYKLTEKSEDFFPKAYHEFALSVLRDILQKEGQDKLNLLFKWRKNKIFHNTREALSDKKTFKEKIYGFKDILETKGYLVEFYDNSSYYILKQYNCPIYKLAIEFKEPCHYELQMYNDLLERKLTREECIAEGKLSCTYVIPKKQSKTLRT